MKKNLKDNLIEKINKSYWWHVPPADPGAYKKRGKFLASTFNQASFYGRPNDIPDRVNISNPLFGFSERDIFSQLFQKNELRNLIRAINRRNKNQWYKIRIALDAAIAKKAKSLGYDSVVLIAKNGKSALEKNRKPNSIELNLLN